MKVRATMTRNVMTLRPSDSLEEAFELMKDEEVRHLPVTDDDNRLVGMLSERDILLSATRFDGKLEVPDVSVSEVMTTDVVACRPTSNLAEVAEVMLERKIDSMPVTLGDGELVGIVTASDFLAFAAERAPLSEYPSIPFNFTVNRFEPEQRLRGSGDPLRKSFAM